MKTPFLPRDVLMNSLQLLVIVTFATGWDGSAGAANWPGFRGPTGQGVSTELGLPLRWGEATNVTWKTAIAGEGWSSPIVWEDQVFVTTATDGGASCRVVALRRSDGTVRWDREVFRQSTGHKNGRNSYATPTPCTDGRQVFVVFGDGSFAALDFEGRTVWVNRDYPFYSEHGLGTSPILWQGLLIMARDGSGEGDDKTLGWQKPWDRGFVVALDTATGRVKWKTGRGSSRIAHVVPNLWTPPGAQPQVISGAGDVVQAFDAATGTLLWTSKNVGEGVVPSIVLGDGLAFTASGWGGRESTKAFRLEGKGDQGEANLAWEQRKSMPRIPSFVFLPSRLYGITEGGVGFCLKADSGDVVWQERVGGTFSASPVAADGRIYFLSDTGETTVIAAADAFEVLARNPLGERCQASMAVAYGHLFIRTERHVVCVGR